uniref:Uncharacterized protein n=1 Tax=Glossina morsitans morsitans TaxID=37546 RepID=A0A1B0G092_GLOMM
MKLFGDVVNFFTVLDECKIRPYVLVGLLAISKEIRKVGSSVYSEKHSLHIFYISLRQEDENCALRQIANIVEKVGQIENTVEKVGQIENIVQQPKKCANKAAKTN